MKRRNAPLPTIACSRRWKVRVVDGGDESFHHMCDVTRTVGSLEELLPWMGPVTLDVARVEIENHTISRGYDVNDVDWSKCGHSNRPLAISPLALVPARQS